MHRNTGRAGMMLGARRIGSAQLHGLQGGFDVPFQRVRFAEADQPAQRAFAVTLKSSSGKRMNEASSAVKPRSSARGEKGVTDSASTCWKNVA